MPFVFEKTAFDERDGTFSPEGRWAEDANRAIAKMNGTELKGRALTVNEAKPKRDFGNRGGRRNRY